MSPRRCANGVSVATVRLLLSRYHAYLNVAVCSVSKEVFGFSGSFNARASISRIQRPIMTLS
jgi:hypothetical protein